MNPTLRGAIASVLSILACTVAPLPGLAHQYWLAPSRYEAAQGDTIELRAAVGTGFRGPRLRWNPERAVRLMVRGSSTVDFREAAAGGEIVWTRLIPANSGGTMIAFESRFAPVELLPEPFEDYLEEEGLDEALRVRRARMATRRGAPPASSAQPVRERYRRCAKTWIAGDDVGRATEPLGLPVEIVPERAPGGDSDLPVRVIANGIPFANALVRAWRHPRDASGYPLDPETRDSTGVVWSGRTNANGRVVVPTAEDGEWLVSVVHMVPSSDPAAAEWESTWASLTFERQGLPRTLRIGSVSPWGPRSLPPTPR